MFAESLMLFSKLKEKYKAQHSYCRVNFAVSYQQANTFKYVEHINPNHIYSGDYEVSVMNLGIQVPMWEADL